MNTLTFQGMNFDIVTRDNQPWLRSPQIGDALGYEKGRVSIDKIYKAHADEFTEKMTAVVALTTDGGKQLIRVFSLRGAHLLAMFARTAVAKSFRVWVLDVLDQEVERLRATYTANPRDVLTASQAEQLRVAMRENSEKLPKGQQGPFSTKGWSRLKSHFGVTYRSIPQFELTEALSMIGRHAADWEIVEPAALPAPEKTAINESLRDSISRLATQMLWLRSWWTANGPAIKAINSELASTIHDRFIDGAMIADGLGYTIGQEFPEEYIKNYPWRGTEQDRDNYRRTKSH